MKTSCITPPTYLTKIKALLLAYSMIAISSVSFGQECYRLAMPTDDPEPDTCNVSDIIGCTMGLPGMEGEFYCDPLDTSIYTLKVNVNILKRNDGTGGRSFAGINQNLQDMVDAFMPLGILFSLEGIDDVKDDTIYGYNAYDTNSSHGANLFAEIDHPGSIDIYFCGPGIFGGGIAIAPSDDTINSAIIMGSASSITLIHEMGHVLGLLHTFESCEFDDEDCPNMPLDCNCGDHVLDTAYDPEFIEIDSGCVVNASYPATAPIHNFMSHFEADTCRNMFTEGQRRRMKRFLSSCPKLDDFILAEGPIRIADGLDINFQVVNSSLYPAFNPCLNGFVVEPGAKLTINSDVQFGSAKKILVKSKARLNVNGVTLSACDDDWIGIEVEGNASIGQFPTSNQGMVRLYENSVIENASNPLNIKGGGIVLADEAVFSNCGESYFHPYSPKNFSRFTDCQFTNDEVSNFPFTSNIYLDKVKDVTFDNCDFSITGISSGISGTDTPSGIFAHNSRFGVGNGSSFEGYYTAIQVHATGAGVDLGFNIENTTFYTNYIGVDSWASNNAIIRNCTFSNIGGYGHSVSVIGVKPVGVQLRDCTGFQVTDNSFSGSISHNKEIGILAYNTGADLNILRRNTFSALNVGDQAELSNRGQDEQEGLQYWCNTNSSNQFDFAVFDTGISQEQGTGLASKNTFSYVNNSSGDFKNQSIGAIKYFYKDTANQVPMYYFNITLDEETNTVPCANTIVHTEEDTILTGGDEGYLDSIFTTTQADYLTLLSEYDTLSGSAAEALEPELAYKKTIMHLVADRIIRSELADTTEIDLAKVRTWLRNKDSKASEYAIVESWLSVGDSTHAVQVLDSIPMRQKLSAHDSLLHDYYKDWVELRLSFAGQEKELSDLDSADVELVEYIAEADSVGLAAAQTRGLLNAYYDYDYRLHPKTPSTGGLGIMAPPSSGNVTNAQVFTSVQLTAFPNPAKNLVKFKYQASNQEFDEWLTIHDLSGRLVGKLLLQAKETIIEWKTDGLASGVYYYKATVFGSVPQKLVLIK